MILHMWVSDVDGVRNDDDNIRMFVNSRAHATSCLVTELHNTASDEFMDEALNQWFVSGKVSELPENADKTVFWNVALLDSLEPA
jgi:hypothetical protein